MRMELDHIDGGWARLAWAVGGLRLVWMAPQERARSDHEAWPEPASIVAGAMLLGVLAWIAFTTRVPDIERMPAEMVFGFLALYFYSVGFLSGRRTGKMGTGGWAGAACGLTFGVVVCVEMYMTAVHQGVREAVQGGSLDQAAIAVMGLVVFLVMGALCGVLGARGAIQAHRQRD
jgi:hypothetical protein